MPKPFSTGEAARALLEQPATGDLASVARQRLIAKAIEQCRQRSKDRLPTMPASGRKALAEDHARVRVRRPRQCPRHRRAGAARRYHRSLRSRSGRALKMARARSDAQRFAFDAITVEGALIAPAMLARIAKHEAGEQDEADYGIPKGSHPARRDRALFPHWPGAMFELTASKTPSIAATTEFRRKIAARCVWICRHSPRAAFATLGDRQFAVTLEALGGPRAGRGRAAGG